MADWSQLPKDLLNLISTHLETPTDLLRFRSICTTWRSSASPKLNRFSNRLPILPNDGISTTSFGFHLSKRSIFLLTPPYPHNQNPPNHHQTWLIKSELQQHTTKRHLLNPLSRNRFDSLPHNFPPILDLLRFRVVELGHEFVLHYINYQLSNACNLYMEKVVVMMTLPTNYDDNDFNFCLLTIHVSGKLAVFKSGSKKWCIIQEMPSPYDDVILYKEKFYAVDNTGRIVLVNFDLDLELVADSVFGGDKKYLVESEGSLLLVDMYLSIEAEEEEEEEEEGNAAEEEEEEGHFEENGGFCVSERTVRFKVYRLDEGGGKWEGVKSLGDRVVFLGDDCTFSASAREIGSSRGNYVIFADNLFYLGGEEGGGGGGGGGGLEGWGIGVFDLESGCIGPLGSCPEFCKLIWPPPQWITSTTEEVSSVTIKLRTLEYFHRNACTISITICFVW